MTGEFNKIDFITGLSSVIFSKDRAMQLHLLLDERLQDRFVRSV